MSELQEEVEGSGDMRLAMLSARGWQLLFHLNTAVVSRTGVGVSAVASKVQTSAHCPFYREKGDHPSSSSN